MCSDVVGEVFPGGEQTKIVGDATKDHICLENGDTGPTELTADEIFFGSSKGERTEVERMGGSFVQAGTVVDNVAHHPRCGRPAHYEVDVVEPRCTAVPEQVKGMKETGTLGVKTWQLVNKHDKTALAVAVLALQQVGQLGEGLYPCGGPSSLMAIPHQSLVESFLLFFCRTINNAGSIEIELISKKTAHQKSLSYAPTAIYGNELAAA